METRNRASSNMPPNVVPRVREVVATADDHIQHGAQVFFKFTCSQCGNRLTFEEANTLHATGECDKCHGVTDLLHDPKADLNYLLIYSLEAPRKGETNGDGTSGKC